MAKDRAYIMGTGGKWRGFELISGILAYVVWTFIFLVPIIGIIVLLLKNKSKAGQRENHNSK